MARKSFRASGVPWYAPAQSKPIRNQRKKPELPEPCVKAERACYCDQCLSLVPMRDTPNDATATDDGTDRMAAPPEFVPRPMTLAEYEEDMKERWEYCRYFAARWYATHPLGGLEGDLARFERRRRLGYYFGPSRAS
jgi:hypothetical protein